MQENNRTGEEILTKGKIFKVTPYAIEKQLFAKERKDIKQEMTRRLIWEAFVELEINPNKYAEPFEVFEYVNRECGKDGIPKISEFEEEAIKLGGYIGDWVEQALRWAQKISNGETWESICNECDTAKWYRLVRWKNGEYKIIGGASSRDRNFAASHVYLPDGNSFSFKITLKYTVPFVVIRRKR